MDRLDIIKNAIDDYNGNGVIYLDDYINGELFEEIENNLSSSIDIYTIPVKPYHYLIFDLKDEGKYYLLFYFDEDYKGIEDIDPLSAEVYAKIMDDLNERIEITLNTKKKLKDEKIEAAGKLIDVYKSRN